MGKQIAVVMTYEDEQNFLSFLKNENNIILIESFADSVDLLWKNNFEKELNGHYHYYIWNNEFNWKPQYKQTINGRYYISNDSYAPVIEYSRSNIFDNNYGRIYWAKNFAAPNGLSYDVEKFERWYEQIVKRIRKNSEGKIKNSWITYFLPNSWNLYLEKTKQS